MIAAHAFGIPVSGWLEAPHTETAERGTTFAVRLIDRRTGASHRINGTPLVLYTRRPHDAAADLLAGRDPAVWEARIEPIGQAVPR